MKKYLLYLSVIASSFCVSCKKSTIEYDVVNSLKEEAYTITIGVELPVRLQTKSADIYDNVDRLDVYYFDSNGNSIAHETFYGEKALNNRLSFTMRYGTSMNFIFWANLPEELAGYLSRMSRGAILSKATFPLEEMDRMDYPIMCASTSVYFSEDKDITVELYRYTYAIEVGSITADFEEESMKNKRINVKRIVLTNCSNECDLLHTSSYDTRSAMYGSIKTFDYEIFGGGNQGYAPGQPIFSGGSSFSLEYDGVTEEWSEKYKYILNNNINNSTAGRININSTNAASELTTITFDNSSGEGVIGVMDDKSLNTIMTVNNIVYGLPANYDKPLPMDGGVSAQDNTPKLVIEVNIEGETMFYPIQIPAPQPNTLYHIENITLKGAPSPYCNIYPVLHDISLGSIISGISETTVSNIVVGANPDTGELSK